MPMRLLLTSPSPFRLSSLSNAAQLPTTVHLRPPDLIHLVSSHLLCEVSLWNARIYWVFRASSKPVRNFYAVSYLPASENPFKALTNSGGGVDAIQRSLRYFAYPAYHRAFILQNTINKSYTLLFQNFDFLIASVDIHISV